MTVSGITRRRTGAVRVFGFLILVTALGAGITGLSGLAATAANAAFSTSLEGTLLIRHGDDLAHGLTVAHSYALLANGSQTRLMFAGKPPADAMAGQRVSIHGIRHGDGFMVAAGGIEQMTAAAGSGTAVTGTRRVAVLLFNFSDSRVQPYTPTYADGVAFSNSDSVATYYAETSWNQLQLTGDVFGWYELADTSATCATDTWATSATNAATAHGVDLAAYDNVVYAFPYVASCQWSGMATLPGRSSWLNGPSAMSLRAMAHELGHNFGTHHASALTCTSNGVRVALSASCTASEYGDPFSVMGSGQHYEHTNFSRANFGWLSKANTQTITSSGDYTVAPIERRDVTRVQLLRLPRDASGTYLTIEFRQPSASVFDTFQPLDPVVNGVTVRLTADLTARRQTQLIDCTPSTVSFSDAALLAGVSLVDPASGATITTLSVSNSGAVVRITFGSTPTPPPTATVAPTPTATAAPTATLSPTATPAPTATNQPTPEVDTVAPTSPGSLSAAASPNAKVVLSWSPSTDNVGVAGYQVFRDGALVGATTGTRFTDSRPARGMTHTYFVVAYDSNGNTSLPSNTVAVVL